MTDSPARRFAVVAPVDPLRVGDRVDRARWPRHVTVLGTLVTVDDRVDAFAHGLRRIAASTCAVTVRIGEDAAFGPDGSVAVQLVAATELRPLHDRFARAFEVGSHGIAPEIAAFTGDGYRPHLTIAAAGPVPRDVTLPLEQLALVEVAPGGDASRAVVLAVARLGAPLSTSAVPGDRVVEILDDLVAAGIRSWVVGGWGVDALLGRATRDHHDLDLFVERDDLALLIDRIGADSLRYVWSENRWIVALPSAVVADVAGVEVDIHVVHVDGDRVELLSAHDRELPPGALTGRGTIADREVACATRAAQICMHEGYELPEHHRRDVAALQDDAGR